MPSLTVLVIVEVLAPLNQVVHLVIKVAVVNLLELVVVKWVLIERLQLLLETSRFNCCLIDSVTLLCNKLGILCISVKFSQPTYLSVPTLLRSLLFA